MLDAVLLLRPCLLGGGACGARTTRVLPPLLPRRWYGLAAPALAALPAEL